MEILLPTTASATREALDCVQRCLSDEPDDATRATVNLIVEDLVREAVNGSPRSLTFEIQASATHYQIIMEWQSRAASLTGTGQVQYDYISPISPGMRHRLNFLADSWDESDLGYNRRSLWFRINRVPDA